MSGEANDRRPRPNILLITTDQHDFGALGCAGNLNVSTPNIDRLAAAGVRFTNAYCAFPACTPSRASMATGLMPHQVGIDENDQAMSDEVRDASIGHLFSRGGYRCGYAGKWHVPTMSMGDGFGFEVHAPIGDPGVAPGLRRFLAEEDQRGSPGGPFLFHASIDNPHNICEWAYDLPLPWGPIPEPPSLDACPNVPANFAIPPFEPAPIRHFQRSRYRMLGCDYFTTETWRRFRWAYYRLVEKADVVVGELVAVLDEAGLRDDTVIVFASDHGEGAGSHQWRQKWILSEESAHVPFIVVPAGAATERRADPRVCDEPVSTGLDLLPTLADLAGIALEPAIGEQQRLGQSLGPLLEDASARLDRDYVPAETYLPEGQSRGRMIRTRDYKYVAYDWGKHREQLFNLACDPGEMVNLAVESRYRDVLREHREYLRDWLEASGDTFARHYGRPGVAYTVPGDEWRRPTDIGPPEEEP